MHKSLKNTICLILAAVLMFVYFAPMTAYAINKEAPVNSDGTMPHGNKSKDTVYREDAYVSDTPIRLTVQKVKTGAGEHEGIAPKTTGAPQDDTVTYIISGRVEGSQSELIAKYGKHGVELAFNSVGAYLGYGWLTGTKEYLESRKAEATDVYFDIIYNKYGVFSGYAYVTRYLETSDDDNRYVAGATMALYDAIEVFRDGTNTSAAYSYNTDERFRGVSVVRDPSSNNVINAYVDKGFAGTETMYVLQKDDEELITVDKSGRIVEIDRNYDFDDEINDTGESGGIWIEKTVQRGDKVYPDPPTGYETIGTPILYYSLDNLHATSNDKYSASVITNATKIDEIYGSERIAADLYGFDKKGNVVNITQYDELDFSIYVFADGFVNPVFEIVGGDYREIKYSLIDKRFVVGKDTLIYHLDENGNRDSLVDPQTGIAYIEEKTGPTIGSQSGNYENVHDVNDVTIAKTETQTKIYVWPVNVYYDTTGAGGSKSFEKIMTTRIATFNADTADEYTTGTYDTAAGTFTKSMVPKLDAYGHALYYSRSSEKYVKGADIVDYDGDYLGYGYSDALDRYNEDSYRINSHSDVYNSDNDNPFNQKTHYSDSTTQDIAVEIYNNHVINGNAKTPTPVREGYAFCGWLVSPSDIAGGMTTLAKAYWRVAGSSMSAEEHEKWYEAHTDEEGLGATYTVTFDANGGKFYAGGDPHSTDKALYRRLGDALIIDNVWKTGENTPNDPLDTELIDTVENKASGINTVTTGVDTANDPYTSGSNGGNADMLKRVASGNYIMEEISSPLGYSKGFPVGVTVNELDSIQTATMHDRTIKVEFIKDDSPEKNAYDYYVDGVLQTETNGTHIRKYEAKGSYSFAGVKGAVISVEGRDAATIDALSSWVQVTSHPLITKVNDAGVWHFTFNTDNTNVIEGLPAGNYKLTEITIPSGYTKMEDQNITVAESDELQVYRFADDHTKVEINKYYLDGTVKKILPNAYAANLSLIDDTDTMVATWTTDDASDYTATVTDDTVGFFGKILQWLGILTKPQSAVDTLNSLVETNPNASTMTWEIAREAELLPKSTAGDEYWLVSDGNIVNCDGTSVTSTAPAGFEIAYLARTEGADHFDYRISRTASRNDAKSVGLNDQIWDVSNGTQMHVSVFPKNDSGKYEASIKINYHDSYSGKYSSMVAYDTLEGYHRFDYIPEGCYKVRENTTPMGFMTADDNSIVVESISDIQQFTYENKRKVLSIAKVVSENGSTFYKRFKDGQVEMISDKEKAAVIPGAGFSIYYSAVKIANYVEAFKNGAIPSEAVFVDSFVSGDDGKYSSVDYINGYITEDMIGEYRPHSIRDLRESGFYYIVESDTPDYFATADTIEVEIKSSMTEADLDIRPVNKALPLNIKVFKENEEHQGLKGASFKVTEVSTGATVGIITTDEYGYGSLMVTDGSGRIGEDGIFVPYTYRISEINPPSGYRISDEIHEFSIDPGIHEGVTVIYNPSDASISSGILTVTDEESELTISKIDFGSFENVKGTKLSVFRAEYTDGEWKKTAYQADPLTWNWTVADTDTRHKITGFAGGDVLVLTETYVPAGYQKTEDIFFKTSLRGDCIEEIWYSKDKNPYIAYALDAEFGAVESVTIPIKKAINTVIRLMDVETSVETTVGSSAGEWILMTDNNVSDGRRYLLREVVIYDDSSEDVISSTTFTAHLISGQMRVGINGHTESVAYEISDETGNKLDYVIPDGSFSTHTFANPLKTDPNDLTIISQGSNQIGTDHGPLWAGKVEIYEITYEGSGKEIVVIPSDKLNYIGISGFTYDSGTNTYRMTTTEAEGKIQFITSVKTGASGYVNQEVIIDAVSYSYLNPIAVNGGESGTVWEHTSKLLINNVVCGTDADNSSAVMDYSVTIAGSDGKALNGAYTYVTKNSTGTLECYGIDTSFDLKLAADDYILICDLPYDTKYSIKQTLPAGRRFSTAVVGNSNGFTSSTDVTNVSFYNTRNALEERTLFRKNNRYIVTQLLNITNQEPIVLNRYAFSLDDDAKVENLALVNRQTEVWLSKTDIISGELIPGAKCKILDEFGNPVFDNAGNELEWISSDVPKIIIGGLEPDKHYKFVEVTSPDGYAYTNEVDFYVEKNGTINKVILSDEMTKINIKKTDISGNTVEGALLEILESDGTTLVKAIRDALPDSSGQVLFRKGDEIKFTSAATATEITGLLNADETYYLHEVVPPSGMRLQTEDVVFTVPHSATVIDVSMVNIPTKAKFMKTDSAGNPIEGATLEIRDALTDTLVYGPWVSGTSFETVTGLLDINHKYKLVEIKSPDGYYMSASVEFTLEAGGEIEIKIKDDPIKVKLIKSDKAGKKLFGGTFQILNSDGTVFIDTFVINEEVSLDPNVYRFRAGDTYRLHEVTAPNGYDISADVEFTVPFYKNNDVICITMTDAPHISPPPHSETYRLNITKYDGLSMEALPGAEFTIYNVLGVAVKTVAVGEDGKASVELDSAKYTLKETKAPTGYILNDSVYDVDLTAHYTVNISVPDYPIEPVRIRKIDGATGKPLTGAELEVISDKEESVYVGITDEQGYISFMPPYYGQYAVREVKAPAGYVLDEKYYISFEVSKGGVVGDFTFINYKKGKGKITAWYDSDAEGIIHGWRDRHGVWHSYPRSKMGDRFPAKALTAVLILSALGAALAWIFGRRKKGGPT